MTSLMSPNTPTTFSRAAAPLHTATVSTGATEAGAEVWGLLIVLTGSGRGLVVLVVLVVSMTAVRAGAARMRSASRAGESGGAGSLVILVALLLHWPASPGQLAANRLVCTPHSHPPDAVPPTDGTDWPLVTGLVFSGLARNSTDQTGPGIGSS